MNVLFISNYGGEHIGSTQEYLIRVMKRRGNVYHLRPRDGDILSQIVKNKIPPTDYIFMFEGELDHAPEVSKLRIPKIWWLYDSIVLFNQHLDWVNKTDADLVFVREKRHFPQFQEKLPGRKVFWLPVGIDTTLWRPINTTKQYDIGFIGWVSEERGKLLNILADDEDRRKIMAHTEAPETWGKSKFIYSKGPRLSYELASKLYSASKLGFHHNYRFDQTWRPLEVSACGTACLSDTFDGLEDMLRLNKDVIIYNNETDMKNLAEYYLEHDEDREKIAKSAYKNVVNNHTWEKRLDSIETEVNRL